MDQQQSIETGRSSLLGKLPLEIRCMIYDEVLSQPIYFDGPDAATDVEGEDDDDDDDAESKEDKERQAKRHITPLRFRLTCRQINEEVGQRWLSSAMLVFDDPMLLLDSIRTARPLGFDFSLVRHLVFNLPAVCEYDDLPSEDLKWLAKEVPGLKLDTLTLILESAGELDYFWPFVLEHLAKEPISKELYLAMGEDHFAHQTIRDYLQDESRSLFRATAPAPHAAVFQPSTRLQLSDTTPQPSWLMDGYTSWEFTYLISSTGAPVDGEEPGLHPFRHYLGDLPSSCDYRVDYEKIHSVMR